MAAFMPPRKRVRRTCDRLWVARWSAAEFFFHHCGPVDDSLGIGGVFTTKLLRHAMHITAALFGELRTVATNFLDHGINVHDCLRLTQTATLPGSR